MFCSQDKVASLLAMAKAGRVPLLKYVVVFPLQAFDVPPKDKVPGAAAGSPLTVIAFGDLEKQGKTHPKPPRPPRFTDMATFCYTSGTTGDPKGMLAGRQGVWQSTRISMSVHCVIRARSCLGRRHAQPW